MTGECCITLGCHIHDPAQSSLCRAAWSTEIHVAPVDQATIAQAIFTASYRDLQSSQAPLSMARSPPAYERMRSSLIEENNGALKSLGLPSLSKQTFKKPKDKR